MCLILSPIHAPPVKAPSFGERTRRNFAGTRSDLNGKERHLSSHKVPPRPVFAPAWMKKNSVPAEKATRAPPCRNACISVRAATVTICDNRCSRPPTGSRPDYIPRNHRRDRSSCTPRGRAAGAPHRPRQPPHRPQQYRLQ